MVASIAMALAVFAFESVRLGVTIDEVELGPYSIAVLVIGNLAAFAGVPWLASRRKGLSSLRLDFGLWFRPIDLAVGFGAGIAGLLGAGVVGTAIDKAFGANEGTSNVPVDTLRGPGEVIVFFAAVAVVTPVIEELFFRGLLYRSFRKRGAPAWRATAWTTLIFVVPHLTAADGLGPLLSLAASIGVLGLAFNLACNITGGRLGAPIVAHVVVNGAAVIALALS